MKTLYFDCFAGASGDMILGALVALGVPGERIAKDLNGLRIEGLKVTFDQTERSGIAAIKANVEAPVENKHRHLHHIESIINGSTLSETVKERANAIFRRLAEAEAEVHGCSIEKVHFHEVGAADAIADIVGACVGFEILGIERFLCSKVNVGRGFVNISHGLYPVPPPAVANLVRGIPVYSNSVEGELLTPTGAAIISTLSEGYGELPEMVVEEVGYGAGTRKYKEFPNVLRLILGKTEFRTSKVESGLDGLEFDKLITLETNLDDIAPQVLAYVAERAIDIGALDCWLTPIQMKKGRPGTKVSVLCSKELERSIIELLLTETTTLGIRSTPVDRASVRRELRRVSTQYGEIGVKIAEFAGKIVNLMPEYEDAKRAALEHNVPLTEVQRAALDSFHAAKAATSAR